MERYADAVVNLGVNIKQMTQKHPGVVDGCTSKPLGTILNLLIIYSQWWVTNLREKQVYRIDHYLGKDTVNNPIS